jgi:hypothetical protein
MKSVKITGRTEDRRFIRSCYYKPFPLAEILIPDEGSRNRTIILSVVLYGCETWSLTLREEHRLRVFENRVLRRIFGPGGYLDRRGMR